MHSSQLSGLGFIHDELVKARRTAVWLGKKTPFFAEKDILLFTTRDIIEKNVLEDETIESSQKADFTDYVYQKARKLFLMFIWDDLPMYLLRVINYVDEDLPLSVSSSPSPKFPKSRDNLRFQNLITTTQWSFTVPELSWTGIHTKIPPDSTPPITSMIHIGAGSYGGVYKIEIDPSYVAKGIKQPLALKVIASHYRGATNGSRDSSKERDLLHALRRFGHDNIIRLLASFDYLDHLCMIFPLATCDLHKYMDQEPQRDDPKYVPWLMRQLKGLTDALSKIHGVDVQEEDSVKRETGYHRDLKPENILFFQDSLESGMYGTLQISDFGLARFHSDTTGTEKSRTRSIAALGTPRYAPPEVLLGGRTNASASHDLWSFGCIILELLLWHQFGKEGRDAFLQQVDNLFYRTEQLNFEIHDQVRQWIERLECSELHPSLNRVLEVTVNKLLVWDPDGRWTSAELLNFFATLEDTGDNYSTMLTSVHRRCLPENLSEFSWYENRRPGEPVELGPNQSTPFLLGPVLGSSNAIVYKVYCKRRLCALKVVRSSTGISSIDASNEIAVLKRLQNLHIVQYIGSYEICHGARPREVGILLYPAAQFDLEKYLLAATSPKNIRQKGQFITSLRTLFGCLSRVVYTLHVNKIKHQDIKPRNILVDGDLVFFCDFGIALYFGDMGASQTSSAGNYTRFYSAPEVHNSQPRGRKADIFSLGCVFLEMVTVMHGRSVDELLVYIEKSPYYSHPERIRAWLREELAWNLSKEDSALLDAIQAMLNHDPEKRPSAEQLIDIFGNVGGYPCRICNPE